MKYGHSTRFEGEGRIERRRPKGSGIKLSLEKPDFSRCGGDGKGSDSWNVPSKRRGGVWKPQGHQNPSVSLESQTCQPCSNTFTKNIMMTSRNSTLAGNQSIRLPTLENPTFSWSETCACRVATKYRNLEAIVHFEFTLWWDYSLRKLARPGTSSQHRGKRGLEEIREEATLDAYMKLPETTLTA